MTTDNRKCNSLTYRAHGEKGNNMKVKELVGKVADFGTHPHIYIQKGGGIIGGGKPDEVSANFGELKVNSFIAANCGQIKVYVE